MVIGVGVVGCTPAMRYQNISEGCNSEMNWLAFVYNQHLISMLNRLKDELFGFHFSFFDGFSIMLTSIHKPNSFGMLNSFYFLLLFHSSLAKSYFSIIILRSFFLLPMDSNISLVNKIWMVLTISVSYF